MHEDLIEEGETASLNRVARLMAVQGLQGWPRRKRRGPRGARAMTPVGVNNLLERDFVAVEPETKWVTDITRIKAQQGKLFLCIVLDLFDQRVVGWSMHDRQERQMVIRGVRMATWQRQGHHSVILHFDRGSQFRSDDDQHYLSGNSLICSMSAVGHCGDNAACEGFFGLPSVSESIEPATPHWMPHAQMCLTPSSDAIIQGCGEGSPGKIRKLQLFYNRP